MSLLTRKSSRSPISQKKAMSLAADEINSLSALDTKKATEERDAKIIMKYLRMSRGPATKFSGALKGKNK